MPYDPSKLLRQHTQATDDEDDGGESGGGSTERAPFRSKNYLVQGELVKGERSFGEVSAEGRITDPPPEEVTEKDYSEEAEFAATSQNEIQAHPMLNCQALDGRDPVRDRIKPTGEDVLDYARNNPEARLTMQPALRMALENAERYRYTRSSTPTLKPAGM